MTRNVLMLLPLALLASCSWLLEPPKPRTNPSDENAAVYYFRAIPQYNGGSLDRTLLEWNWSADGGGNPGRITIQRKDSGYPQSINDGVRVYQSNGPGTQSTDILGAQLDLTYYYYTLYYEIDGWNEIYELNSPPTVFADRTLTMVPTAFEVSIGKAASGTYLEYPGLRAENSPDQVYAIFFQDFAPFLSNYFNYDVHAVTVRFNVAGTPSGFYDLRFRRIAEELPEDQSEEFYFNELSDPARYASGDSFTLSVTDGLNTFTPSELADMYNNWFSTLDFYGTVIDVVSGTGAVDITGLEFDISYVGEPIP